MSTTTDAFQPVQRPAVALPPAPRTPNLPLESAREWASRYALWSAIHSLNALIAVVVVWMISDAGLSSIQAAPLVGLFFYIFGLPVALVVAMLAAHVLVSLPIRRRPATLRPIFATAALVLGWVPLGMYVLAGELSVVVGAISLVANALAVWRVWHRIGAAPGA